MRKITTEAIKAFMNNDFFSKDNTTVSIEYGTTFLYLHGNAIAKSINSGEYEITTAGWNTVTTKERLNGIPGVKVTTKKGKLYLNEMEWDGGWTTI